MAKVSGESRENSHPPAVSIPVVTSAKAEKWWVRDEANDLSEKRRGQRKLGEGRPAETHAEPAMGQAVS